MRSSNDIRETFLSFFEERGHRRLPSGSLVPADFDPSVLLTTAGMHPLKPYFQGRERPPAPRLTTVQKCFRTPDIEEVGLTARHLTFFEMLGNFSIGDYFKAGAVELALELSLQGFGLERDDIWITVFEGDEALGVGPDEEAIAAWEAVGIPRERIVPCPRSENFWQAGPTGPCGPCSELYLDRGVQFGSPDDLPGGDNERFLEYWNLVFMQFEQGPPGTLVPLPARNIDTGLGLDRLAAILQGVESVFETDALRPLVALGEELGGRGYGTDSRVDRALRILADHTRGMTFLIADGVVPSNEDRGYVLRRIMRRAVQQGRSLGFDPGFLPVYAGRVIEMMGHAYPELHEQRAAIDRWVAAEEESFGRTLEQGTKLLDELIARARERGDEGIASQDAFRLHDTFGFPIDLTLELAAEAGLGVDEQGFEALMDDQRARARAAGGRGGSGGAQRERAQSFAQAAGFQTEFVGFHALEQPTTVGALQDDGERALVKLVESPFYAAGGGQVADAGAIECESGDCAAQVVDVVRLGDDQAVEVRVQRGTLREGERVVARVDAAARRSTQANHTATHLLHAALRARLGDHVRQAGSAVQPDKLRFDFTHGAALTPAELRDVEDQVNAWVLGGHPVRALETTLDEARALGAMALFGEKYGDVVRMVEIGDGSFSRELCGGTHVRSTAEIGVVRITAETSSAANVRRIEALTGPAAVGLLRAHDAVLREAAGRLRTRPEHVVDAVATLQERLRDAQRAGAAGVGAAAQLDPEQAQRIDGAAVLVQALPDLDADALLSAVDRVKAQVDAVVVGSATEGRVHLVASVDPSLVQRGVRAGAVVKQAAAVVGGGGGGRDTLARAGGRDPEKLPQALEAARTLIASALGAEAG